MDSSKLFEKANKLYTTGNYQEAIEAYIKILKKTPNKVSLYTNLAVSYVQLQKYSKAEETFFSGLKINKSDFSLYKNLALMYFSVGDIEASINVLQVGLKKIPRSAALNSLLGDCYRRLDKIDEAITCYKKSIEIEPNNFDAFMGLCWLYQEKSDFKQAVVYGLKGLEINEKYNNNDNNYFALKFYSMVGCCAKKNGKTDLSNKIFVKMAKMKVRTPEDVRAKALGLTHLNQDSTAFELLSQNERFQSIPYEQQKELCSTELLKQNLSKLPNMQLTASLKEIRNNKNPIYFVACDQAYFDKFFEKITRSVWKECPKQRIHVHLMLNPNESINKVTKLVSDKLSISNETYVPDGKTGYTVRRFYRLFQLLNTFKVPILMSDMDVTLCNNLDVLFSRMKNSDVGIIKRDLEAVINQTILAALFYCSPTESGRNFLGFIVNYMLNFEMDKNIHWYVDQMAIFSADNFFEKNNIGLKRFNIPIRTIVNDYQKQGVDTFFKHSKGKGKTFTASPFPID